LNPTKTTPVHRLLLFLCALCLCAPPAAHALEPVPVGPGVYAFLGAVDEPSVGNGANTGNSGFIIGTAGVVVIDTGVSYRHGQRMLAAIASVTEQPVRLVILTHGVQEFVFGAAAFTERGIPLLAHQATLDLMRSRCEQCREQLVQLLGADAMHGTRLILPERTLNQSTTIDVAGRSIELLHFGWGATPGDLAVYDRATGVLFAGGVVTSQRIPELRDGRLQGWLAWLDQLERMPVRTVVPGHGPPATAAAIGATRTYLLALDRRAHALFAAGRTLLEAVDEGGLSAYAAWGGYPILHRRNLQQRYLEYEVEELERP
jgi:glyoxylase-like metal-dependent hydrolase (beta-lactamase superfamily II)